MMLLSSRRSRRLVVTGTRPQGEREAEAALSGLADPFEWHPLFGLCATGDHATYNILLCGERWCVNAKSLKTGKRIETCCDSVDEARAICGRHLLTGDWSELLAPSDNLLWKTNRDGWTAPGDFVTYRIRRRLRGHGTSCRVTYEPEGVFLEVGFSASRVRRTFYRCPCRYGSLKTAQLSCKQHHHLGEWREAVRTFGVTQGAFAEEQEAEAVLRALGPQLVWEAWGSDDGYMAWGGSCLYLVHQSDTSGPWQAGRQVMGEEFRHGASYPSRDAAQAACEHHLVTGRWTR